MLTTIKLTIVLYAAFVILVLIARFAVFCIDGIKSENARIKAKQAAKEAKRKKAASSSRIAGSGNRSARWTQRTHVLRVDEYICSACKASFDRPYEVCPSCGATMKKPRYDPSWVDEAEELSAMLDDDR